MWLFPLKTYSYNLPEGSHPGAFGAVRRHDIHTGIDLYCPENSEVLAVENSVVVGLWVFTGAEVGSPWWETTYSCALKGPSGIVLYGELNPEVVIGQKVMAGEVIGSVKRVLKVNKGRPLSMLHLELYQKLCDPVIWELSRPVPEGLLDPTSFLKQALTLK